MSEEPKTPDQSRMLRWQGITLVTLFTGYSGYYICRSNFAVVQPLILQDPSLSGITTEHMGMVASAGLTLYTIGKVTNGVTADYLGGRGMFLLGMFASVICTLLFGLASGVVMFAVIWSVNRYVQSAGWVALVKVASRWFPYHRHASIMAILSLSFLIGDVFARNYLGALIHLGVGWRGVFFAAAGALGLIALASTFTLKSTPEELGLAEPEVNPANVFGQQGELATPGRIWDLLGPMFMSPAFWFICGMNFGLTLIRETFSLWTPLMLTQMAGLSAGNAAIGSSIFPLIGGVSALAIGFLSDYFGGHRARIMAISLFLLVLTLWQFSTFSIAGRTPLALSLVGLVAFFLLGPYTLLSGVLAIDIGGKKGSSTATGFIDSAGYAGSSIVSGWGVGKIAHDYGWSVVFHCLAIVAAVTTLLAVAYWIYNEHVLRKSAAQATTAQAAVDGNV